MNMEMEYPEPDPAEVPAVKGNAKQTTDLEQNSFLKYPFTTTGSNATVDAIIHTQAQAQEADFVLKRKSPYGYFITRILSNVMKHRKRTEASLESVDKTPANVHQLLVLQLLS